MFSKWNFCRISRSGKNVFFAANLIINANECESEAIFNCAKRLMGNYGRTNTSIRVNSFTVGLGDRIELQIYGRSCHEWMAGSEQIGNNVWWSGIIMAFKRPFQDSWMMEIYLRNERRWFIYSSKKFSFFSFFFFIFFLQQSVWVEVWWMKRRNFLSITSSRSSAEWWKIY